MTPSVRQHGPPPLLGDGVHPGAAGSAAGSHLVHQEITMASTKSTQSRKGLAVGLAIVGVAGLSLAAAVAAHA